MMNGVQKAAGVVEPVQISEAPMGLGRRFAAFSQEILDRYAIWENYPWSDAVIQFLQAGEEEEASEKKEPSSFFVTVELLKLYVEKGREEQKTEHSSEDTGDEELTARIEAELKRLQAKYDRCFGILERLYREGRQMPREELAGIWAAIERESGRRAEREHVQRARAGEASRGLGRAGNGSLMRSFGSYGSGRVESVHGRITPLSLRGPWNRFRRLTQAHSHMPNGKELFRASVQRQQREFYSKIVREYVVQETERQARNGLGRELRPFERQALAYYGASLGRAELAYYAASSDREALYQETAAFVLRQLAAAKAADRRRESGEMRPERSEFRDRREDTGTRFSDAGKTGPNASEADSTERGSGSARPSTGGNSLAAAELRDINRRSGSQNETAAEVHRSAGAEGAGFLRYDVRAEGAGFLRYDVRAEGAGFQRYDVRAEEAGFLRYGAGAEKPRELRREAGAKEMRELRRETGEEEASALRSGTGNAELSSSRHMSEAAETVRAVRAAESEEIRTESGEQRTAAGGEWSEGWREQEEAEGKGTLSEHADRQTENEQGDGRQGIRSWEALRRILDQIEAENADVQQMETEEIPPEFQTGQDAAFWQELRAGGWVYREESQSVEEIERRLFALTEEKISSPQASAGRTAPDDKGYRRTESSSKAEASQRTGKSQRMESAQSAGSSQRMGSNSKPEEPHRTENLSKISDIHGPLDGREDGQSFQEGGQVYREDSPGLEEIGHLLSSLPDSVSRIAAQEVLGHLGGVEDGKREALNRTIHSLPETRGTLIFKSWEGESADTLPNHTALYPVRRPGTEKKIQDAETRPIETRPSQPDSPENRPVLSGHQPDSLQNRLTQPEYRTETRGQENIPASEGGTAGQKPAKRTAEPESRGWTANRGAEQTARIAEEFKAANTPLHLLPLRYGADLVYRIEASSAAQEPGAVLRPAGKSGEGRRADGFRRESCLLSEVWEQASPEEKRELFRYIPRAVEQAIRRMPDLKTGGTRPGKTENLWNQAERSLQRENPQIAGKTAGGAELVLEESRQGMPGRQPSGQEPAHPLSVGQEPGRTLRQSMLSEALVWLAPQAGMAGTAGQGRYADGKDIAGTAKAREGRGTPRFSNGREIPGIPGGRNTPGTPPARSEQGNLPVSGNVEIPASLEFLKMPQSLESQKNSGRAGGGGNAESGESPGVLPAPGISSLPESGQSFPLSYPELDSTGIVYAQREPVSPAASQKEGDIQALQELETRITRQEYIIRQERIEREELERRLKKQESRSAGSKSGTEGKVTVRPNGQLPQNVVDQLKEQLRLDRIRYGAD